MYQTSLSFLGNSLTRDVTHLFRLVSYCLLSFQGHYVPKHSAIGCIRDLKLNEVAVGEPQASRGVSLCFDGFSELGTYFGGDGSHVDLGWMMFYLIDPDEMRYYHFVSIDNSDI